VGFFYGNFVSLPVDKAILQSSREKPEGFWTLVMFFFVLLLSGCFLTKKKTVSERNVKKQEVES